MFGYINANKKTMSGEEASAYKAYYCGLCQQLKKDVGLKGQVLLNYDLTFLAILLSELYELERNDFSFICALHPTKKKTAYSNEALEYAGAMDVMLSYHNLMDDYRDEKNWKKHALAKSIENDYQCFSNKYKRQSDAICSLMEKTYLAELQKTENVDILSGYTGECLAELFDWKEDHWSKELRNMGFYMGKFIYFMDAYEDRPNDEKFNSFNPLIGVYQKNPSSYEIYCESMLSSYMSECAKSFERLPIIENAGVLRNILYSGVWTKYEYLKLKRKLH